MGAHAEPQYVLEELALGQMSTQNDEQGALINGCSKNMGDFEGRAGPKTFFGKETNYWVLMVASGATLMVGQSVAMILGRYYYVHGGSRMLVYTWTVTMGWPVLVFPLLVCYCRRSRSGEITSLCSRIRPTYTVTCQVCLIYLGLGALSVVANVLYSLGALYLPVSTNALLCSSQLVFNALFAYLLMQHKMSCYILNSIVIITTSCVLLGVSSSSDKPRGTSNREYIIGFVVTIAASAISALLLPLLELLYTFLVKQTNLYAVFYKLGASPTKTDGQTLPSEGGEISTTTNFSPILSFLMVLEVQIAISAIASMFALLGMCINGDLQAMHEEALHFDGGVLAYVLCLCGMGIGWQLCYVGGSGIIALSSALMSCIFATAMIPIVPALGVIVFQDTFSVLKGIAMMLSICGFMSYVYDGYLAHKSKKNGSKL